MWCVFHACGCCWLELRIDEGGLQTLRADIYQGHEFRACKESHEVCTRAHWHTAQFAVSDKSSLSSHLAVLNKSNN